MLGQKQARIADFFKVVDNELSTTFHTMFVTSPFLGVTLVAIVESDFVPGIELPGPMDLVDMKAY
jgi:hypothetical protein